MDYLRNLGSAAASSLLQKSGITLPFSLGEKVISFEGKTIWSLYDATKRDDSSPVSVFSFDANQGNKRSQLPLARNALRKLRTIRHPDVLKFIDVVETDSTIHIVTERVQPLSKALHNSPQGRDDWLCWGLHRVATALAFVNESCASTHGNLHVDSVFVASSGEWRLGGFELLSNAKDEAAVLYTLGSLIPNASMYASPEVAKSGWSVLKELPIHAQDAYALGLFIYALYNPNAPLPSNNATTPPSRGSIPNLIFAPFKKLLNPNVKARLTPKTFLDNGNLSGGYFTENPLVKVCKGLSDFALSGEGEKLELLRTLKESSDSFPPSFTLYLILPSLMTALQHAGATAPTLLPLILQLSSKVPPSDYNSLVLGPLVKLFASPDRGTRMALLEHLPEYADKLDEKMVVNDVWPHFQTGFTDTVAVIREATIRAITLIAPKLSTRILNNDLLRHLARAQNDQEPSIRTNTAILLGRLAPSLSTLSCRKVLVPAFTRAVKDSFVHARVSGLMAFMACGELFDPEDMAKGVLPIISLTLIDGEKLVRDQAFKTLEYFVKRLEEHARNMPETTQADPATRIAGLAGQGSQTVQATLVNSAAGAAGALAGWAISSLGKKLTASDMQTGIGAEGATSAPAIASTSSSSTSNGFPFNATAQNKTVVPRSVPTSPRPVPAKGKNLQLGATKAATNTVLLAAEWAEEEGTTDAWDGDLMDVNADTDDWSAFETAPITTPPTDQTDDNDAWGEFDAKLNVNLPPTIPKSPSNPPKLLSATQSLPKAQPLRMGSGSKVIDRSPSPNPPSALSGLVVLSKEEKAAEIAKRKEERKQRIAALKEAKSKKTAAA